MEEHFFEALLAILCTSLVATVALQRLRLSSIIAYLIAGALIGPHSLGWVAEPQEFSFLAEFGVVFLLFSLGLEFSLSKLTGLRSSVFGLGGIQVLVCTLVFGGAVWLWGTSVPAAVVIAGALALSSTAIVTKELSGLHQVHSRHGQLSIGVLLFQDLAAVVFLILVPVLGGQGEMSLWQSLVEALVKGVLLVVVLLSVGNWVLPHVYREVAKGQSEEIFLLSTLVIVLLAAWVTHSFGLSMALGGFVIGMMLGESHYRHQISSDIRAFKDILLGLFFVTIGMNIEVQLLLDFWPRLLLFTLGLIVIKLLLISALVRFGGDSPLVAVRTGLNLAQAGEFGLALLALGVMHGVLPGDQASFILLLSIFSMAVSPLLIRHSYRIALWLPAWLVGSTDSGDDYELSRPSEDHVIIGGFGRVGQTVARLLEANDIDYIAIDQNVEIVTQQRALDHNVTFGDCTRLDILQGCHIENAKMAILTFRSIELAKECIAYIRSMGIRIPIIVRCHQHGDFAELVSLGADHVVPEMLEASLAVGAQVLELLNIDSVAIDQQLDRERESQLHF